MTKVLQADVAKRRYIPLTKKISSYVEAGISGMVGQIQLSHSPYLFYTTTDEVYPCYCFVGGDSGDFIKPATDPSSLLFSNDELNYGENIYWLPVVPGIMLGTGLSIDISKKIYTGLHADIRSYYNPHQNGMLMYLRSGLHVGVKF